MSELTIQGILKTLDENKVDFCIWKNTHQREDMLAGNTDVDLHIPLAQKQKFETCYRAMSGIEVLSPHSNFPAVSHIFLLGAGNKMLHLHVYFEIFTGESHLKDYMFPISKPIIANRVADPELGYLVDENLSRIIYVLRHYIKKSSLLGIIFHFRERKDYANELKKMTASISSTDDTDFVDREFLLKLDADLESSNLIKTWWRGKKLRLQMRGLKRMSPLQSLWVGYKRMFNRVLNAFFYKEKKSMMSIGRFVAITGLDGSGKTTLLENLHRAFKKKMTVHKIHLGRPPATLLTLPLRMALALRKTKASTDNSIGSNVNTMGTIGAIRYAALAYERNRLAQRVLNWVTKGHLVLADRYPSKSLGKMDSPRIGTEGKSALVRRLGRLEQRLYATMVQPDLLIEVRVSLETAQARNDARDKVGKETVEELAARYAENSDLEYAAKNHVKFLNEYTEQEATDKMFDLVWNDGIK